MEAPHAPALPRSDRIEDYKLYLAAYSSYLTKYGYYVSVYPRASGADKAQNQTLSGVQPQEGQRKQVPAPVPGKTGERGQDWKTVQKRQKGREGKSAAEKLAKLKLATTTKAVKTGNIVDMAAVDMDKPQAGGQENKVKRKRGRKTVAAILRRREKRAPKIRAYNEERGAELLKLESKLKSSRYLLDAKELQVHELEVNYRRVLDSLKTASDLAAETAAKEKDNDSKKAQKRIAAAEKATKDEQLRADTTSRDLAEAKSQLVEMRQKLEDLQSQAAKAEAARKASKGLFGLAASVAGGAVQAASAYVNE